MKRVSGLILMMLAGAIWMLFSSCGMQAICLQCAG